MLCGWCRIGILEEKLRGREEAEKLLEAQAKELEAQATQQQSTLQELETALKLAEHSLTLKSLQEQEVRRREGGREGRKEPHP